VDEGGLPHDVRQKRHAMCGQKEAWTLTWEKKVGLRAVGKNGVGGKGEKERSPEDHMWVKRTGGRAWGRVQR